MAWFSCLGALSLVTRLRSLVLRNGLLFMLSVGADEFLCSRTALFRKFLAWVTSASRRASGWVFEKEVVHMIF